MIYGGERLAAEIPSVSLPSFVLRGARELGAKAALIDGPSGRTLSYIELERSVRSFAAGLAARGFTKGETFAIFMPNSPEYAVAFHGVLAAGGRCTTANPLSTAKELGRQLADSGARMLLTAPPFLDVAMLSHRNLVANLIQAEGIHAFSAEDVIIAVLPFFHIYGLSVILNQGLLAGATIVTMPRFELETFLDR